MKLSTAIEGYFLDRSLELAPTTVANYRHYMSRFVAYVNDRDIESITKHDVIKFLASLKNDVSDHTLFDIRARLATLWTWAGEELGLNNIVAKVPKPTYKEPEIIPYSLDEIKRLLKAAEFNAHWKTRNGNQTRNKRGTAGRDVAIILTLLDTGMRASELCALTIDDYDGQRGRFHIKHGKGDKGRFCIAGKRCQKAIWRYLAGRPNAKPHEPLFATGTGEHLDRNGLYHMIKRCGDRAGVKNAGCHRFRHTFAIEFLRNDGHVFQLKELLGHEDVRTLQIYVKIAESDIDGAQRHSPADNWKI
ncbi:MAG: tyrosine-type recombinase/integrase [Caldilineaceae bacterium]|jgi:integrase/recombinase XerD